MLHIPEEVVKRVIEEKEKNSKTSSERIASKISKELGYDLVREDVQEILTKSKELIKDMTNELEQLNNDIAEEKKYDFEDNHYIIIASVNGKVGEKVKERYKLPLELVDGIFNDYSRHGANMSGQAIMTKYKLKPNVRSLIKNRIGLYKDSHILSPMSMDIAQEKGTIEETILDATYENFQDKYKNKYKDAHIQTLEKLVKKQAKTLGTLEGFLEQIAPLVNSIKPIHIEIQKHKNYKGATPVYHIGDTHLGKIETGKVVARLDMVAQDIINNPSKEVYINCLGDIFEAVMQGGMHSGQIETMDGIYGAFCVILGTSIGISDIDKSQCYEEFCALMRKKKTIVTHYRVSQEEILPSVKKKKLAQVAIGEEGIIDLTTFTLQTPLYKNLRNTFTKCTRNNYRVEFLQAPYTKEIQDALFNISQERLHKKRKKELGFSQGYLQPETLDIYKDIALLYDETNTIIGFNTFFILGDTCAYDLMRYKNGVSNGVVDFFLTSVILHTQALGCKSFSLGLTPMCFSKKQHNIFSKALAFIGKTFNNIHHYQDLRYFKQKYHPERQTRYFLCKKRYIIPFSLILRQTMRVKK